MNGLQVHCWPIDKPVPYARNSRKIPERAIDEVAASIREFGWRQPIVVDKNSDRHVGRFAAIKLDLKQVPVHVAENLTPAQVKALRLMDNRSHEDTDWDIDLLGAELEDLRSLDFDLELTRFNPAEIEDFPDDPDLDERAKAVPPIPDNSVTKLGDLRLCRKHRVLCADATEFISLSALQSRKTISDGDRSASSTIRRGAKRLASGSNGKQGRSQATIKRTGPHRTRPRVRPSPFDSSLPKLTPRFRLGSCR
jgi:hypothetical protein